MRAGNRPEHDDQHVQDARRGAGVGQQGDRIVSLGQVHAHDPGTNHAREQQRGAEELGQQFPPQGHQSVASSVLTR